MYMLPCTFALYQVPNRKHRRCLPGYLDILRLVMHSPPISVKQRHPDFQIRFVGISFLVYMLIIYTYRLCLLQHVIQSLSR